VPPPTPNEYNLRPAVTGASALGMRPREGCTVVVTEGTGSFYASRNLIQMLHDFGKHKGIVAHSDDVATTKKSMLTRNARYTGLLEVLSYTEGEVMGGADSWLAINADEAALPAQIASAKSAGVKRVFVLLTEDGPTSCPADVDAMKALLEGSGMAFTVMRTGALDKSSSGSSGGGLRLGELDEPVCYAVGEEDVYRFVTEALTLPEAEGRMFSLCPSTGTQEGLRQMRCAGMTRRDEVAALLKGLVPDSALALDGKTAEQTAEEAELVLRSAEEVAAERAEELEKLISKARERGIAIEAKAKAEEEEKLKFRAEQQKYYAPVDRVPVDGEPKGDDDSSADDK